MDPQELHNMLGALVSNCPKLEKVCETWGNQHMLTIAMEENAEIIERKVERSIRRTQDYIYELQEEASCNGEF